MRIREKASEASFEYDAYRAKYQYGTGGPGGKSPAEVATKVAEAEALSTRNAPFRPAKKITIMDRMIDYVTPGYYQIVKEGKFRPVNPMSITQTIPSPVIAEWDHKVILSPKETRPGNWIQEYQWYSDQWVGSVAPQSVATESDINALQLEAMADLKSSGMDYLTSVAEFRETKAMFTSFRGNLQERIAKTSEAWEKDLRAKKRKGKFRGFNSLSEGWNSFSSFWLEYRFGWRILYYDMQAISGYIEKREDGKRLFTRRQRAEFSASEKRLLRYVGNSKFGYTELWGTTTSTETVGAGYSAVVDPSILGNPILLNTLYEITPWTLVVDMFFNVQDNIIASSKYPVGIQMMGGSGFLSRKIVTTMTVEVNKVPGTEFGTRVSTCEMKSPGYAYSYSRSKVPDPYWDVTFQPNLDPGKILDLATLALPILKVLKRNLRL